MNLWLPGAERIAGPHSAGNPMTGGARHACTWHRTVGNDYTGNRAFLVREGFEPTVLWDPWTGETGQFLAADRGAYALKHVGDPATNTLGALHVQIEVADHGLTVDITDTPMVGWPVLREWLAQLGIPETFPAGPMLPLGRHQSVTPAVWGQSGHFGHCHVPENDHTDPGPMDADRMFHTATPPHLLVGTVNRGYATLHWTGTPGATGYDVYQDSKQVAHHTAGTHTTGKLHGLHHFRVLALGPGVRVWSNVATIPFP